MNVGQVAKILFILLIILILIGVNIGFIRWSIWFQILKIWPIIVIAFVLEFAIQYFNYNFLRIIPVFLVSAAILSIVYLSGLPDFFSIKKTETREITQLLGDNSVKNIDINIDLNNARLNIGGGSENLYDGAVSYREKIPPAIESGQSGSEHYFRLKDSDITQYLFGIGDSEHILNLKIKDGPFLNLEAKTRYGLNDFNFTNTKVLNIKLDSEHDSDTIKIGNENDRVRVNAVINYSKANFLLPSNAGLRIRMDTKATITNLGILGLNESNNVFLSSDYLISDKKIDIDISSLASIVNFELY